MTETGSPIVEHRTNGNAGSPDPVRRERITEVDGDVEVSYVELWSPLPSDFPEHPAGCDTLAYMRYRMVTGPTRCEHADAICVMMPGALAGGYSMDRVARNTLRAAAAQGKAIEWWSLGRRPSLAWDRTGIDAAVEAGDPAVAFDYYYGGLQIDGRRFAGFTPDRGLGWLGELGLAQTMRDYREVIVREVPDPKVRRSRVFVGGHSLGGWVAGFLGAWDFGGQPGHDLYAGLIALDSLGDPDPLRLRDRPVRRMAARAGVGHLHHRLVQGVRQGLLPRSLSFTRVYGPETLGLLSLAALEVLYRGDQESTMWQRVPDRSPFTLAERFFLSRTWRQFVTGSPNVRDFRTTGEATLVAMFSDRHNPFNPLASSVGQLDGPLATKSFPFPGWFRRVPGLGTAAAGFVDMGNLLAPTDPDHLYHWRPNDRLEDNVVDLDDLARMLVGGPLGFLEGWFSALLVFEIFLAVMGARDGTLGPIRHERSARQKPMVHVLADERSAIPTLLRTLGALPADAVMLPDYQHVDTATAAAERPDRGHEPAAAAISDFVIREVGR